MYEGVEASPPLTCSLFFQLDLFLFASVVLFILRCGLHKTNLFATIPRVVRMSLCFVLNYALRIRSETDLDVAIHETR